MDPYNSKSLDSLLIKSISEKEGFNVEFCISICKVNGKNDGGGGEY